MFELGMEWIPNGHAAGVAWHGMAWHERWVFYYGVGIYSMVVHGRVLIKLDDGDGVGMGLMELW